MDSSIFMECKLESYSRDMGPLNLNPKMVHGWHKTGGTLLQTSRGGFHLHNIVDAIQRYGFNQVNTGHIALHATLSSRDVDCCLIPENKFYLDGKGGLFELLELRLKENGHAVVVVAVSPREQDKI
ncbi:hypothetical protein QYF36_008650 [Acer negundo]|nr:hypothetical protein QYF36_008650 [Acer negundo]